MDDIYGVEEFDNSYSSPHYNQYVEEDNMLFGGCFAVATAHYYTSSGVSTDTRDMLHNETLLLEQWQAEIPLFINLLHHTVFEDGESNSAIEWVEKYYRVSHSVTILWIYSIYSQHQENSFILDSLLRIISFIEIPQCMSLTLVPLIKLALHEDDCQESAIMLCEIWRSKECLDALEHANITNRVLKSYLDSVRAELKKELAR